VHIAADGSYVVLTSVLDSMSPLHTRRGCYRTPEFSVTPSPRPAQGCHPEARVFIAPCHPEVRVSGTAQDTWRPAALRPPQPSARPRGGCRTPAVSSHPRRRPRTAAR
jgi:hypothetical protein